MPALPDWAGHLASRPPKQMPCERQNLEKIQEPDVNEAAPALGGLPPGVVRRHSA